MAVLYRKYRPQIFSEVLNQKPVIQTLKNQVAAGTVAHAYLFTGGRGVGKTSVARILAKAVNCQGVEPSLSFAALKTSPPEGEKNIVRASPDPLGEACGQCSVCKQIEHGNFIDMVEVDAASNTGVDNIRELIEHVKFSPTVAKYKVFIIDEVHMLSKGAFNALLKTLEEPPKHATFILATTEINKVPPTIISRTQRFDFKALSAADLTAHLQKISLQENLKFTDEVLNLIAQNSEGSVRDALSLLDKIMTLGSSVSLEESQQLLGITDIAVCENLLEFIARGEAEKIPDFFSDLGQKGADFLIFNRDFLEYLRKNLIYKITGGQINFALQAEHLDKLKDFESKFEIADLIFTIRLFLKSYKDFSSSPDQQIPLLLAAVEAAVKRSLVGGPKLAGVKLENKLDLEKELLQTPIQPEIKEMPVPEIIITLEEVQNFWPKVIAKIKELNGPLASMLKAAQLQAMDGNKLIVTVKFLFDKQSLGKNALLISKVFKEVCGNKITIDAQVIKTANAAGEGKVENLAQALKVFGGELIE